MNNTKESLIKEEKLNVDNYTLLKQDEESTSNLSTLVFVDYESWFYGLYKNFKNLPDLNGFMKDIKKRGKIQGVTFFGDFTAGDMENELARIRTITSDIVNCSSREREKDYTDFIMLDSIYKASYRDDIQQFIFVTGDGHFHSVTAFLKNFRDKAVGIYSVQGCLSTQLKDSCSWCMEIKPLAYEALREQKEALIENLDYMESVGAYSLFKRTVDAVVERHSFDATQVAVALSQLIDDGLVTQRDHQPEGFTNPIPVLLIQWDKVYKSGFVKKPQVEIGQEALRKLKNNNNVMPIRATK